MFFGPILPKPCRWSPRSIIELRWKFRVSQREFGDMLGVDLNAVKSWETARRTPSETTCRLFDILWADSAVIPILHRYYKMKEEVSKGVPSTPIGGIEKVGGVLSTPGTF